MKRAFVIDTVLVVLLAGVALGVGPELALKALRFAAPVITVDGPDVLSRFQQRVGWACALVPFFGWAALLPLHLKGRPSNVRRLATLLLPLVGAALAGAIEAQWVRVTLADTTGPALLVGVDVLPLATTLLFASALVASALLVLNLRGREPM